MTKREEIFLSPTATMVFDKFFDAMREDEYVSNEVAVRLDELIRTNPNLNLDDISNAVFPSDEGEAE